MDISVVIPLLNEEDSLNELTQRIDEAIKQINKSYEIVFIDDGSSDGSYKKIIELKKKYSQIIAIRFRRNFGKSAALSAGFQKAKGDVVITMDADLQDDPAEIPNLLNKLDEGCDLVSGWKKKRHDPLNKTVPSKLFNGTTRLITGIKIHDFNCGLKAYRSDVIKELPVYGELHRYLPVLAHWQGFRVDEIVVNHHERKFGESKFGARRLFTGFFDLLTVLFITRYRQKPLHLFGLLGMISIGFGFIIDLYLAMIWFQGTGIGNRPLLFLGTLLIIIGVQFFSLGLIGEMLTSTRTSQTAYYSVREELE
jgi:glycosyltransferase involved in cell wall biosynthesis